MVTRGHEGADAELLSGVWCLGASSHFFWLDAQHGDPRFQFWVEGQNPLLLTETVRFEGADGVARSVTGSSRPVGGGFVWRGAGKQRLLRRRWELQGMSPDAEIAVVRSEANRVFGPGLSILIRDGIDIPEFRGHVAANAEALGVSAEDFASLTWIR